MKTNQRIKDKKWKNISWPQVWRNVLRGLPQWTLKYPRRPKPRYYRAEGGPLHGHTLVLADGTTAPLRIGSQRGRYRCGLVGGTWHLDHGTTKWIPAEDV